MIHSYNKCAAPHCGLTKKDKEQLSFHCFPPENDIITVTNKLGQQERIDRRQAWMTLLQVPQVTHRTRVCSSHFEPYDFFRGERKKSLKRRAVPTLCLASVGGDLAKFKTKLLAEGKGNGACCDRHARTRQTHCVFITERQEEPEIVEQPEQKPLPAERDPIDTSDAVVAAAFAAEERRRRERAERRCAVLERREKRLRLQVRQLELLNATLRQQLADRHASHTHTPPNAD